MNTRGVLRFLGTGTAMLAVGLLVSSGGPAGASSRDSSDAAALTATPAANPCPAKWGCADIGGALPAGGQTLQNGVWTVTGGGGDIWGTADAFHFMWQAMPSTGSVVADVTSQSDTDAFAKAGVMIRATTDPGSAYYAAFLTPGNGIAIQWRASQGASSNQMLISGTAPAFLKVSRYIDTNNSTVYFTAYTSADGTTWTAVPASTQALAISGSVLAGLAVTSHDQGTAGQATFQAVRVSAVAGRPPVFCPTGWSCPDIGSPQPAGSQVQNNGNWTVVGGGGDIWGTSDSFHFVYKNMPASGTVVADVTSQQDTDAWAKAGVMIRATTDPGAAYYAAFLTPGNGVAVQWRTSQGATSNQILMSGTAPIYLRVARYIARSGVMSFTAYTSTDGTTWTPVPSSTETFSIPGTLLAGLAITSHDQGTPGQATFTSVAVTVKRIPPPA